MLTHTLQRHFSQDLTAGALLEDFIFHTQARIRAVHLSFTTPVTETVTITRVDSSGNPYNTSGSTKDLEDNEDYIFHPEWDLILIKGDRIRVECTNANTTGIVYGTIHIEGGI